MMAINNRLFLVWFSHIIYFCPITFKIVDTVSDNWLHQHPIAHQLRS